MCFDMSMLDTFGGMLVDGYAMRICRWNSVACREHVCCDESTID